MIDGTVLSSIVVAICGMAGTVLAARASVDKKRVEDSATTLRLMRDEIAALEKWQDLSRARDQVAREYITTLRVAIIREGHDPPQYPDVLKNLL